MASDPSEWSVAELLERCKNRPADDLAWQEFIRRYNDTIKSSVIKTYHRKVREEADRARQFSNDLIEDLVQAVYLRLIENGSYVLASFKGKHANSIYLFLGIVSANVVRDYFREIRAQKRPRITDSTDELQERSGDRQLATNWDNPCTMEDIENALKKCVSGKNQKRDTLIFWLRFEQGLTLEEIVKVLSLKISPISVGSILNRITRKLKPMLEKR